MAVSKTRYRRALTSSSQCADQFNRSHIRRGADISPVHCKRPERRDRRGQARLRRLRLSADEDAETSYNSLRTIVSLDIAPDPAGFKNVQRIAARVNPKIAQIDGNDAINLSVVKTLEDNGYLAEARKRVALAR